LIASGVTATATDAMKSLPADVGQARALANGVPPVPRFGQ